MAIIGAGAIGCEFADFYNAVGTEVIVVEMLDHLLPNEDDDVSHPARAQLRQARHQRPPQDQNRQGRDDATGGVTLHALRREAAGDGRGRRGAGRHRRHGQHRRPGRPRGEAGAVQEPREGRPRVPHQPGERLGGRRLRQPPLAGAHGHGRLPPPRPGPRRPPRSRQRASSTSAGVSDHTHRLQADPRLHLHPPAGRQHGLHREEGPRGRQARSRSASSPSAPAAAPWPPASPTGSSS